VATLRIELFTQKQCPRCSEAKAVIEELKAERRVEVSEFDVESIDGMAEAAYYGVMSTPSVVLVDRSGEEIMSWRGVAPDKQKIIQLLDGNQ